VDIHLYSRFLLAIALTLLRCLRHLHIACAHAFLSILINFELLLVLNALSRSFSRNLPTTGKLQRRLYLSPSRVLTKRDCIHLHGGGQPVPPTLDSSGGSSHSRS
jgi:hypothetical protein